MAELRGWNFPITVDDSTGRIKMVEDNENVKQGVKIILRTQPGERFMRPDFGTDTNSYVFESITPEFLDSVSMEVGESIRQWENNITSIDVEAIQSSRNNSLVKVDIGYTTRFSDEVEGLSTIIDQNEGTF